MKFDQCKVQNTWHAICQLLWGGKALGTACIKRGILPCEFVKCHTRIHVTAVLAGNQKKENILGDSVTEREKQNDTTRIHKRRPLIPPSLITEHKNNAAIVEFGISNPLTSPFSVITEPQTIKAKTLGIKPFSSSLIQSFAAPSRAAVGSGGLCVPVLGFVSYFGVSYTAQSCCDTPGMGHNFSLFSFDYSFKGFSSPVTPQFFYLLNFSIFSRWLSIFSLL